MTSYQTTADIRDLIAPCYYQLHSDIRQGRYTFYNLPGGRGSAKSSFCSVEIPLGIMRDESGQSNALVVRKYAVTLRSSVFAQIQWAIEMLGVSHLWKASYTPLAFTYVTGQQIKFAGLDDSSKLKSIKPMHGYFKYLWLEEFSEFDGELEIRSLQQSVMRGSNDFIVLRSFNPPISANNWANQYIQVPDVRTITLLTNYTMIPSEWLGEAFLLEAERLKETKPKAYEHEYLGVPTGTGGEVFPDLEIRQITEDEINSLQYIYSGVDFGFAADPACYMRVAYDRKYEKIYLLDELYKRGMSNRQLAEAIAEKKYYDRGIVCDCAEPKSIADLRDMGLPARACHKAPGCVEYRVRWLQHRTIVIDPSRTPNAYREFTQYSYPVDKNGNLLSQLVDAENHSIDSVAYALDQLIFSRGNVA
ncbi:MAG: PBSX family phage terminase large subunit [Lachnospiraceae bacterium]|nr:PBSX family phage terminase large subunit [Lachnospiraceae bacterium]